MLATVVTDSRQRHHLVAGETHRAGSSVFHAVAGLLKRFAVGGDASLARTKSLHLFVCRKLWGTQNGAAAPFEVAAIGIVPQSGLRPCSTAVEVHWVHHVSNVGMLYCARHNDTLR